MELITERLILREFKEDDWPDILAYQADPLYLHFYDWTGRTPEAVQEFVRMHLDQQQEQPRTKFQFAVTLKSDHQLIGTCGIRMASADAHEGDIGYELSP
jgi:RimJ/RimL family protein N-acetyltransferase